MASLTYFLTSSFKEKELSSKIDSPEGGICMKESTNLSRFFSCSLLYASKLSECGLEDLKIIYFELWVVVKRDLFLSSASNISKIEESEESFYGYLACDCLSLRLWYPRLASLSSISFKMASHIEYTSSYPYNGFLF